MIGTKRMYIGPDGDVVEATSHEYVTRLKHKGYVLTEGNANGQEVSNVEQTEEQQQESTTEVQVETPEATSVDEAVNTTFRRSRDR